MVLEACVNGLLRKWSLECNDGDFVSLLARLDVENSADVRARARDEASGCGEIAL